MDIIKLDKNLAVNTAIDEPNAVFYDVRNKPFDIYGLLDDKNNFFRMPIESSSKVSDGVRSLSMATAGGRVRFCTDSEFVAIDAKLSGISRGSHFTLIGCAGFDLYVDDPDFGTSVYRHSFMPPLNMTDGYTSKVKFKNKKLRYFTINFPTYTRVSSLFIGIEEGATLSHGMKYRPLDPVVYYGSSITQGGCASRPGNAYQAIVSRRLNMDFVNLGFSGNARGEAEMAKYIAGIPCSVFVFDYDHNAPSSDHLEKTHYNFYKIIRDARPDLPIVFMSRCDAGFERGFVENRRLIIADTYRRALCEGDTNVYFIDGMEVFRGPYEDMCTVDGCHPNDIGFALMADSVEAQLKKILVEDGAY